MKIRVLHPSEPPVFIGSRQVFLACDKRACVTKIVFLLDFVCLRAGELNGSRKVV